MFRKLKKQYFMLFYISNTFIYIIRLRFDQKELKEKKIV